MPNNNNIAVGTHDLTSLRENALYQEMGIQEFGEDTFLEILQNDLAAHNQIVAQMNAELVARTTDRQRRYGVSGSGAFLEVDEYSRVPTQKRIGGGTVGFPLRLYQYATGFTARGILKMSVAEMAGAALDMQTAHVRKYRAEIKKALYLSANYTWSDFLGLPVIDLAVKRLANADGMDIPNAPDGTSFNAATHTHYSAINGVTASALEALINNVVEHGHGGRVVLVINFQDESTITALTGFVPAPDPRVTPATTAAYTNTTVNITTNRYDRYVGLFKGAEVWIRPWAIQSYILCYDAMATQKPLVQRVDTVPALVGLRPPVKHDVHPLHTEHYEDSFGYGVWNRTAAAILYTGGGSYTDPTITE